MAKSYNIAGWFGANLAEQISKQIKSNYSEFDDQQYIKIISNNCEGLSYTQRVELHASTLRKFLPQDFEETAKLILNCLGPKNEQETGTFKNFYWVLPFSKYIQNYGLDYCDISLRVIEEITQRSTGEYALRPFIIKHTESVLEKFQEWARSDSFHLRRLASEGLRPKLPWAPKLDLFVDDPSPVFEILEILKEDQIKYVQKSVANHMTDYLKVNPEKAIILLSEWNRSENKNTQWIVKHANRKLKFEL